MTLKRILLIDDNESEHFLYKAIINSVNSDVDVLSVYDGVEALEYLEKDENEKPDCILLDINMPRMNGLEFLEKYSEKYNEETIVVTMLTSSIHEKDKTEALQYDCVKDFFLKPLDPEMVKKLSDYVE